MTDNISSVDEILEFAIAREVEANQLYLYMATHLTNPEMQRVCENFAKEELEHKAKLELELMKIGAVVVTEFDVSGYAMEEGDPIDMSYEDLLVFAINKEGKSTNLYRDLAKIIKDEESRKVLLSLAQEEIEHKQCFEIEYNHLLKEN